MHREEKICALGSEVVNAWFKGIAMGPEAARAALEEDVDGSVEYRSAQVLRTHKGQVRGAAAALRACPLCRPPRVSTSAKCHAHTCAHARAHPSHVPRSHSARAFRTC